MRKIELGDTVEFTINGEKHTGIINVIDFTGTFFSDKPSADILDQQNNMLYKHINLDAIKILNK